MPKPLPRKFTVLDTKRVSPSMHQVTLGGAGMKGFPPDQQGGYVKLLLGQPGFLKKPLLRTYTIRAQREDALDVQFALHGDHAAGPATQWALDAQEGDTIHVGGPGPAKPFASECDYLLIAGDMSALPAIAANFDLLSPSARGTAVLEIQHEDDAIALNVPDGVDVQWIVNPQPGEKPGLLADALRAVDLPDGTIGAWAACEFSGMRALRQLLRDELGLKPPRLYISSYWKLGLTEGEHKKAKKEDAGLQP